MGDVYAAVDETLQRRVALKSIRDEHRLSDLAKARFLREARMLSQLDHPNVCRAYDYIEEGGHAWLVLELVTGRSLRDAMGAGLDGQTRFRIAEQIASVLVATHAAGVVHRDLKPGNVMLTPSGDVKVLDFGLARSMTPDAQPAAVVGAADFEDEDVTHAGVSTTVRTQEGMISGTIGYMSPEQAFGELATAASDMYSYGLVLQELFTERPPYPPTSSRAELLARVRSADTLPITGIDADVADLVTRLESLAPSNRPTAVDVVERLKWIREKPARRVRRLIAGAVAAAMVIGAIKYTYDLARERTLAVNARQDADRRRSQAENLIGFMLGDLRTKLQQVGRLDLLEDVGREATNYFKAVPATALSSEEVYRRSQTLYQIGQIRQAKGNLASAVESYRNSLALIEQLAAREPSNPRWQLGLVTAHFYVGDALRLQGNLVDGMRHMRAYKEIAERLVALDPNNAEWKMELGYGHSNIAGILEAQGDVRGALAELEATLPLKQTAAGARPDNVEWQRTLASTYNRLGVVLQKLGRLREARDHYAQDLAIEDRLLAEQPSNARLQQTVAVAHSYVALVQEDLGESDDALRHYEARAALMERLVERDRANADWQRELAAARMYLADANAIARRSALAESQYRNSMATLEVLFAKNATSVFLRRDVGSAHARLARLLLSGNRWNEAATEARSGIAVLTPLLEKTPPDRDGAHLDGECELALAMALQRTGQRAEALVHGRRAIDAIGPFARASDDPSFLQVQARALRFLGQDAEARTVVEKLNGQGYRNRGFVNEWSATGH